MRGLLVLLTVVSGCDAGARNPAPPQQVAPAAIPAAVVFVVNSKEIYVGNTQHETDPYATYPGVWPEIHAAFVARPPAQELPAGSMGATIGYASASEVLMPMQDVARMNFDVLLDQRPHRYKSGGNVADGIIHGLEMLDEVDAARRILVVISPDSDWTDRISLPLVHELREQADAQGTTITLVEWWMSFPFDGIGYPDPTATILGTRVRVRSPDELAHVLRDVL